MNSLVRLQLYYDIYNFSYIRNDILTIKSIVQSRDIHRLGHSTYGTNPKYRDRYRYTCFVEYRTISSIDMSYTSKL